MDGIVLYMNIQNKEDVDNVSEMFGQKYDIANDFSEIIKMYA